MALEAASFISDLVSANPAGPDGMAQGDDHIRLIKSVLKSTFPNLSGAVTANQERLSNGSAFPGAVWMYTGLLADLPDGWALADGGTYEKSDGSGTVTVPDLRGLFVVGSHVDASGTAATGQYKTGDTGGTKDFAGNAKGGKHTHTGSTASAGSHSHSSKTGGKVLTQAQLPNWNIKGWFTQQANQGGDATGRVYTGAAGGGGDAIWNYVKDLPSGGGGEAHDHTISADGGHTHDVTVAENAELTIPVTGDNRPPFYALALIVKL
jgi:hypothetical protein